MQLELFTEDFRERPTLVAYWRKQLTAWPRRVFDNRHYRDTTGWSMATGGFVFARLLFGEDRLTRAEYKRFRRFHRRVSRWDRNPANDIFRTNPPT
jgi:hypothetical protein